MAMSMHGGSGGVILPAPACDLLDRFTAEFALPLTLTDLHGAVVASTAGLVAGEVDPHASELQRHGAAGRDFEAAVSAYGRICLPVRLAGRAAGALIVHDAGERSLVAAPALAIALGLALDFAEVASTLAGDRIDPGWLLHCLLRGPRAEAQRARVVSSIHGWNLFVRRVALVVTVPASELRRAHPEAESVDALVRRALGPDAYSTPSGQVDETEWVALLKHERGDPWGRVRDAAESIRRALLAIGLDASVGIGEAHVPVNRIAALRRSYREGLYSARLGTRLRGGGGLFELRGLGPAAFFAPSSPSRRNLAATVLAPLRAHPAIRGTLEVFLARDMSVAHTAAQLDLHRHTVRNHLERVLLLTGLDPRSLEGAVQLKLALLVASSDPDLLHLMPEPIR
jgi:hypothetical protein